MQIDKRAGYRLTVSIAALLSLSYAAEANDDFSTTLTGYGTVGGTFTSDSNYAFHHDASEFTGATNSFDTALESRVGVQAVFDFGSGFSVTAQEVARRRGDKEFDPGTEWLYAQYSPTSDWKLRVGRVVLGTFLFSDSRQVGYAAPWFSAPTQVYGAEPFNNVDGGQVLWHHSIGTAVLSLQSSYGKTKQTFQVNGQPLVSNPHYVFNASATVEYGNVLVRVSQTKLDAPETIPLSATYSVNYNLLDKFTSVGLQYDDGKAIALGEWTKRTENLGPSLPLPLAASSAWYVAGGWRVSKFTPLLTYAMERPLESLLTPAGSHGAWSGSLRYDVVRNLALKAQVSRPEASSGVWINSNPTSHERVNVYSVGADFVF